MATRRAVKLLRREVTAVATLPKLRSPLRWVDTAISFGPDDLPINMAGAGELPLLVAPTVSNACLKHVLVDGGAGLNVLSSWAFTQLQISKARLTRPHLLVGLVPGLSFP